MSIAEEHTHLPASTAGPMATHETQYSPISEVVSSLATRATMYHFTRGSDFQSFLQEFNKRVDELNQFPCPLYLDENWKSLHFVNALSGVDYFRPWIGLMSRLHAVAGCGNGPPISFDSLAKQAEEWNASQTGEKAAVGCNQDRRSDAGHQ